MRALNFKRYSLIKSADRPPMEIWERGFGSLPFDVERDKLMVQLEELGFDAKRPENLRVGFLGAPWRGHPRLAMLVVESINGREEIAVSLEPAPPYPAGKYFDDPTLREICEEAYRQRTLCALE